MTVWQEKSLLCQKNKSKLPTLVDTNLGYLTFEGPGRQTVDARSTLGLPRKLGGMSHITMTVQTSYVGGRKVILFWKTAKRSPFKKSKIFNINLWIENVFFCHRKFHFIFFEIRVTFGWPKRGLNTLPPFAIHILNPLDMSEDSPDTT